MFCPFNYKKTIKWHQMNNITPSSIKTMTTQIMELVKEDLAEVEKQL